MAGKKFSIEAVFSAVDKISAPMGKIRTKLGAFGKSAGGALKGANKAVDKGLAGIGRFSNAVGVAGVASVAGLGFALKGIIEEGAQFERTMVFAAAQFPGMIRQGTKEFDALKTAALAVGEATEFSAQEAAEGLSLLATAGLSAEQSMAALPKLVNFAMASKVDFARASDIANDAMGAFGLTSKNAATNAANLGHVMDVLTRTAADSTTNVEELFEAVRMGGPIAKTAGASMEEFVGMAGVLASVGLKGAEAGTAIRNAFLELGSPSSAATKGLKKLGIQVAQTKDGAIDMTATIGRFAKASAKMTKAQKIQALGSVFGARTVGPFIALMDAGVDVIGEFQRSLEKSTGTTEGMATVLQQDTLGALRQLDSQVSGLKLSIFDAIRPVLLEIVGSMGAWVTRNKEVIATKFAEWTQTLKDNLPEIWKWTKLIVAALAGFLVLATIVKTISMVVTVVGWLSSAFAAIKAAALVVAPIIAGISWPILAIAAAVAVVVGLVWAFWPEISAFFSGIADWAIQAFTTLWDGAKSIFNKWLNYHIAVLEFIVGAFVILFTPVKEFLAGIWDSVSAYFQGVWGRIVGMAQGYYAVFLAVWTPVADFFGAVWQRVFDFYAGIWNGIIEIAKGLYAEFLEIWRPIVSFFDGLWNGVVEGFKNILGPIIDKVSGFIDRARGVGRKVLGTGDEDTAGSAATAPQVVSPQSRAATETAEANARANVDGKIVVEATPGTKASVKAKPRTVPISLQPSGAF